MVRNILPILRVRNLFLAFAAVGVVTACGGSTGSVNNSSTSVNSVGQITIGGTDVSAAVSNTSATSTVTGTYFGGTIAIGQPQTTFQ